MHAIRSVLEPCPTEAGACNQSQSKQLPALKMRKEPSEGRYSIDDVPTPAMLLWCLQMQLGFSFCYACPCRVPVSRARVVCPCRVPCVACPCRVPVSCALCRVPNNRLARLQTCRNLAGVLLTASYSPVVIVDRNSLLPNTLVCVALFHIVICYSFFVANHSVLLIIQCCHSVLPFGVAVRSHDVVVVGVAQQVFKLQWNAY